MIRAANLGDVPVLVELEVELFLEDAWSAELLAEELVGVGRQAWVAVGEDAAASGFAITMTVGDIADLQRIGVHPKQQRSGIARALLEQAMAAAKDSGADRMLLEVSAANGNALGFYAAAGFTEIDRRPRYYKDGSDAIVMRRSLAPSCSWG